MKEVQLYKTQDGEVFDDYQKALNYQRNQLIEEYGTEFETVDGLRFKDNDEATAHEDDLVDTAVNTITGRELVEIINRYSSTLYTQLRGAVLDHIANTIQSRKDWEAICKNREARCEQLQSN